MTPSAAAGPLDDKPHRIDAGVFIGGNYLSSDLELGNSYFADQVPGSAFLLGFRGTYLSLPALAPGSALDPRLAVEVEAKLAFSSTDGMTQNMRDSYFSPVLGWRAQALLEIWNQRKLSPFAVLGFGGETVFSNSPFMRSVDSDAEIHWGLGATYELSDDYGLRGDFRHGITAGRSDLSASTIEFHLGFYYSFGFGSRKRVAEPAPVVSKPEPVKPPEPAKPVDTDGDGIVDAEDRCPNRPESPNQIDDADGCPEEDSDNDGIFGTRDKCPEAAEDKDDFEDEDGCPENDNDGDGISDRIDECPLEKENLNGFEDGDGCPDTMPAEVTKYTGVIKGIRFRGGSARLHRRSHRLLKKVAAVLKKYPAVRLRISGHTDNSGSRAKNTILSHKRADAIKSFLVDRGIDANRLEAVGHGPNEPIGDNNKRSGRAKNRRIEFELLPGVAASPDAAMQPSSGEKPAVDDQAPAAGAGDVGAGKNADPTKAGPVQPGAATSSDTAKGSQRTPKGSQRAPK